MPRSVSYHEGLVKHLQDPLEAASYIEVVLEEGDPKMLGKALKNVIEAQSGIERFPAQVKQCYRANASKLLLITTKVKNQRKNQDFAFNYFLSPKAIA
ncbi:DNA-binding protein [Nostoc commune]|uniref:helix-turn-helix domain-containing transcriptional regulator n=1 Tax=Nostoc commune TaxID=1178 RepID=UPI001E616066|nr:hypothetical protein [Nostoc commune]